MSGFLAAIRERFEIVIGLEVHTHLATRTKLFSPAPLLYGEAPNHAVHPIDLGLPGVLPVLNERAVELAIRLGLALHATVNTHSVFARKNYFYPDLPKGYQISQYELPVVSDGWLDVEFQEEGDSPATRRVRITRAHLEEDAGKSIHEGAGSASQIDLNRCGAPLLEIVSEPDMRGPAEAAAYLRSLRAILRYTGVSEADMEKGQFRCDANVSLRPRGTSELGTRTELKNLNSFRFVEAAIEAEVERQARLLESGRAVVQCTLGFDAGTGRLSVQRVKESASDYRYFPDPDLIPLAISEAQIARVRVEMPELPDDKRARFERELGLSRADARVLTESRALADFFERAAALLGDPRTLANWLLRDVAALMKERELEIDQLALTPENLAKLLSLVSAGRVTVKSARDLLPELALQGGDPEALVRARGLEAVQDGGVIEAAIEAVIAASPAEVERYRQGDGKVLNFLMGQVMKRTEGKANAGQVRELLQARLAR